MEQETRWSDEEHMSSPTQKSIRGWCFLCQAWHPGEQYSPDQVYPWRPEDIFARLDHLWRAVGGGFLDRQRASELAFNVTLSSLVSRGVDSDLDEKVWMFDIIAWVREVSKEDGRVKKEVGRTQEESGVDGGADGGDAGGEQVGVPDAAGGDG